MYDSSFTSWRLAIKQVEISVFKNQSNFIVALWINQTLDFFHLIFHWYMNLSFLNLCLKHDCHVVWNVSFLKIQNASSSFPMIERKRLSLWMYNYRISWFIQKILHISMSSSFLSHTTNKTEVTVWKLGEFFQIHFCLLFFVLKHKIGRLILI